MSALQDVLNDLGITPEKDVPGPARPLGPGSVKDTLDALEPGLLDPDAVSDAPVAPSFDTPVVIRPNGQEYHCRLLADQYDVSVLRQLRKEGVTVLFSGYPGCGKTSLVEGAFADEGGPITFAGHGEAEIGDLVGSYVQRPDGTYEWKDGPLVLAMKQGRVLFVDDATLTPSGVLARLYPAMDGRGVITLTEHEGEEIVAQPGFFVVGAHNPGVPGAILSEALASRFAIHLDVPTDLELALKFGVERTVITIAKSMQALRTEGKVMWAPEMRELLAYVKVKNILGRTPALQNLVSLCPESDRAEFGKLMARHLPVVEPLRLKATTAAPAAATTAAK